MTKLITVKPLIYSLLAGIFLGIYFRTWTGAPLFVFIITLYFVAQFIADHLRGKSTSYLCMVGVRVFMATLLVYLLPGGTIINNYVLYLLIAMGIPVVLYIISRNMVRVKLFLFPLALVTLGGIIYIAQPGIIANMINEFRVFFPSVVSRTTSEMRPLIFPSGNFSLFVVLSNYTMSFFLCLIALGMLAYQAIRRGSNEVILLVVWSLVILALAMAQIRFCYYFAVNVALLSGYLLWRILWRIGLRNLSIKNEEVKSG